ncbi:FAD/NAD(P)-binding domain-containing protein [Paraphaeosphaeria sporulosa]|uniref:FAD/NAD(P)-binding domain-containing protein n=1 Tax=Paraphaeosphaeria sporulosa TaxID=1460663 RepID=A0A177D128_9PLEO|nr:FAD/NAD(P)-binding domain-containing protein [Paraphaeosphaeria sporulosa]OAG12739.1 FAD/NAD(P)-binding domain-containing protein [Paraphaeosphaeria sporulosa]
MPPRPQIVDALIIGGGPAGLAASLAYARTRTTAIVFDSQSYRNEGITHMHTVPSRDHINPYEFRSIAREQITSRYPSVWFENVTITQAAKKQLGKENYDGFEVTDGEGQSYQGKKLILATGSRDVYPDIEGFKENWPQHIYQCLACDGFEQRGMPIGILDCSPKTAHFTNMALNFDARVTVLTNGAVPEVAAIKQQLRICEAWGAKVDSRKIKRLVNNGPTHEEGVTVEFEEGEPLTLGFIAIKTATVNRSQDLIDQLGVECVEPAMGGHIKIVNPMFNSTSVRGVFAGGDTCAPMKQVTISMADGLKAAAGAGIEIATEKEMATQKLLEEDFGGVSGGYEAL